MSRKDREKNRDKENSIDLTKVTEVPTLVDENNEARIIVNELMTQFKGGSLMRFGASTLNANAAMSQEPKYWIPTGILPFDESTGGGFPTGRVVEIHGPEASYKTGLGIHGIECNLYMGGVSALDDNEQTFDPSKNDRITQFDTFIYDQENELESYYIKLIKKLECIRDTGVPTIVVWDSIPATRSKVELKGKIGEQNYGAAKAAAIHTETFPKLIELLKNSNCSLVVINQTRANMNQNSIDPYSTPGGSALKFYATIRVRLEPRGGKFKWVDDSSMDPDGFNVSSVIMKNKLRAPFRRSAFTVIFGNNIGGCPAMSFFKHMSDNSMFASTGAGRYSIEGIDGWCFKRNFQSFYRDNIEQILEFWKLKTGFEYSPKAREAVIRFTRELYKNTKTT